MEALIASEGAFDTGTSDIYCQRIVRYVIRYVSEIRPHPSYVRHHLRVPTCKLSALVDVGDFGYQEPIVITRDGMIVDGYARWELAGLQGRTTLPCIEYELTEAEALYWILQRHRRSNGLNNFTRILLALELEPWLREKALSNQRVGGQNKGSSKLTEAGRMDVRSAVAQAAGVCDGNVTMVKQLMTSAHPELLEALRSGEIRVHRAWKWSKQSPEQQTEALRFYRSKKGVHKTIRDLISRHKPRSLPTVSDVGGLVRLLSAVDLGELGSVAVLVVKAAGRAVYVTEELLRALKSQEESTFVCATESR